MSVDVDLRSSGKKARKAIANFRSATSSLDPGPDWTKGDGVDVITEDCEGNQEEQPGVEGEQGTGDIKADEEDHDRHLEQADKILKYQEEDEEKGNKEKISESLEEGTDGETVVGHELPAEPPAKVESVMSGLFDVGAYDHILEQIFTLLDGNSLAAASSTCKRWKGFIKQNLWKRPSVQESLHHFWSCHLPTFSIKFHRSKILSMKCNATLILCGEDMTGQVVIYSRQEIVNSSDYKLEQIFGAGVPPNTFDAVKPRLILQAHERSVTTVDLNDRVFVTGSADGSVKLWGLELGEDQQGVTILTGSKPVHKVLLDQDRLYVTQGSSILVFNMSTLRLLKKMREHEDSVLCMDINDIGLLASGSADKNVLIWSLKHKRSVLKLIGHTNKVRAIALTSRFCASGSWDRTCRLWSLSSTSCVRIIRHEMFVRSVAMDHKRIATGDVGGYVYIWSLDNCLNPEKGPESLCLRAHNAIDSDRPMREQHRMVYDVHLEDAVLVAVAGQNGRIAIQDFWKHGGLDTFQLESYAHNVFPSS